MKFPEHLALSYLLAQFGVRQEFGPVGTGLMLTAGFLPDLDTLTVLGGWRSHNRYHRVVGHGLPVTVAGPPALAAVGAGLLGAGAFWALWGWLQLALVAHLATDVLFYRWPVQWAWPLSRRGLGLGLVGWNDLVPTLLLYAGTAIALLWPAAATAVAAASLAALALYLGWRALRAPVRSRWLAWLNGGWARGSPRLWRWLTGDFIT
jgi:hypothetical protein